MITGKDLIAWGFTPGKWFARAIQLANEARDSGHDDDAVRFIVDSVRQQESPPEMPMRTNTLPFGLFLEAQTEAEVRNLAAVIDHMDVLMRVPTIVKGAVMPDACPSGSQPGTIPVGGVVATRDAIHPGFHSSDICCSVAITVFKRKTHGKIVLDAVSEVTHFGPGGRPRRIDLPNGLIGKIYGNPFLREFDGIAYGHFGSQGDGNHFAYVGYLRSTGQTALVTHHGSRGLGAQLYKKGMAAAQRHTAIVAPRVPKHQAWLDANSENGRAYWDALQIVREWTKASHYALHDLVARKIGNAIEDRFWNEHNFVFQRDDGLFYHGKGATPSFSGFSEDDDGRTLIPLNMSEPILITRHRANEEALGFAPHGAGRNFSRSAYVRENADSLKEELWRLKDDAGLDIRSFCGAPDLSELPSAYKNAAEVRRQIAKFDLARVVDEVLPYGSIMAGDWEGNAIWRKGKQK